MEGQELAAFAARHASGHSTSGDHALRFERMIHASDHSTSGDHALRFERMIHASGDSTSGDHALDQTIMQRMNGRWV
jgi:hypothetical protein